MLYIFDNDWHFLCLRLTKYVAFWDVQILGWVYTHVQSQFWKRWDYTHVSSMYLLEVTKLTKNYTQFHSQIYKIPPHKISLRYIRSLYFDRYLLTTITQDTPHNLFSIIQKRHSVYIGVEPLSIYNFPPQPGSAPQVWYKFYKTNKLLVCCQREFETLNFSCEEGIQEECKSISQSHAPEENA